MLKRGLVVAGGVVLMALVIARAWMQQPSGGREAAPPASRVQARPRALPALSATPLLAPPLLVEPRHTTLSFRISPEGTDYDSAEFEWLKPLEGESTPAAPPTGFAIPLTGISPSCPILSGYYRLTLKNIALGRVADFIAAAALPVRADNLGAFPLPETMSRRYVGYVGARRGPPGEAPVAVFCAAQVDVRRGTGEFLLVFDEPKPPLELDYASLRPRPDNAWPITNVFLEDAARLSFDCPLSHVDHRVVIDRSDGFTTMVALPVPPEDDRQLAALLQRMRDLLKAQARTAAANPARFDARYRGMAAERLPNYEHLRTLETFRTYVKRVTSGPPQTVEVGDRLRVVKGGVDGWLVKAERVGEER
jgi:hypothetical protein